ncbi:MAG: sigma-70 family RNA polymerase sigma factor [Patescibacteria group bacterium]
MYDEIAAYLAPLNKYPTLTAQEDYEFLFDAYTNGTEAERLRARNLITYGNIKLVVSIAMRYTGRGLSLIDLIQEGVIGLFASAIPKYNIALGWRFSTYASKWIKQAMGRAIHDIGEKEPYRIPVHYNEQLGKTRRACGELYLETGQWPKEIQVFERMRQHEQERREERAAQGKAMSRSTPVALADVVKLMAMIHRGTPVRLDAPIASDDDESLIDIMDMGPPKTETVVEARRLYVEYSKAIQRVEQAVDSLSPRHAMVVRLRLGLGDFDAMSLEEIGQRYDLTRERIRQIEVDAMSKLEAELGISKAEIEEIIDVAQDLEVIANAV